LFGCLCCCWGGVHGPPRGASVACCHQTWCDGDHLSFSRLFWLPDSSHLPHLTCVVTAVLVLENLFSSANASRSFSSSSHTSAKSISETKSDVLYALKKILRLGVQFSLLSPFLIVGNEPFQSPAFKQFRHRSGSHVKIQTVCVG